MRGIKALLMIPMAAVLLLAGACTNNGLDDGDSADVILEVIGFTTPPVTAVQADEGTCSVSGSFCRDDTDCAAGVEVCNTVATCTLTVVDWSVQLSNVPKNSLAADPANDIAMIDVTISYAGLAPAVPARAFGLGGLVIPTGGSAAVSFTPIALNDLNAGHESTTAALQLLFRGQTLEGTTITMLVGRDLSIEECL